MKSCQCYQCLILSINIANVDRAEYLGLRLCFELFGAEHIGIAKSESFYTGHKTKDDITHKRIFIHPVTFLKSITIQENIPSHGMPVQIDKSVETRSLCAWWMIDLFVE